MGNLTDTYTYDAFGIQIASTGTTANEYRYTGQQWDADLGMYYLRARYYKPELGLFWAMDSYEGDRQDPLSLQKFIYCQADPINGTDASGNDFEPDSGKLGVKAHTVFSLYCAITRGIPSIPGATLHTLLPHYFTSKTPGGNLKPDLVDLGSSLFYELKPISHQQNSDLQILDAARMRQYDRVLNPIGFYRGISFQFVAPGTLAGSFIDEGVEYAVYLYPENNRTSAGFNGKGLIYYDLVPTSGPNDPVYKFLKFLVDNPLVWAAPTGYKVGRDVSLPVGRLAKARALAKSAPAEIEAETETKTAIEIFD